MRIIRFKSFATKLSVYIGLMTTVVFLGIMLLFYNYCEKRMTKTVIEKSHNLLKNMAITIDDKSNIAETALNNMKWYIENNLNHPDSLINVVKEVVKNNDAISGSSIAFRPYYYKDKGKYYMLYASVDGDDVKVEKLGGKEYDYFNMDWYKLPAQSGKQLWSEPYYDKGGGNILMSTYSYPLYDKDGKFYAMLTVDISLSEFNRLLNECEPFEGSLSFMLSKGGYYISGDKATNYKDDLELCDDSGNIVNTQSYINKILSTGSGTEHLQVNNSGVYLFYTSIPDLNWSLCTVCRDEIIFSDLYTVSRNIILLFLLGLIILVVLTFNIIKHLVRPLEIISCSAKEISDGNFNYQLPEITSTDEMKNLHDSFRNMQESLVKYMDELQMQAKRQERIDSELHIAKIIQEGMLPKIFPPFPDRKDVNISAILKPAKEVGGDLYNFFIDDEKLYYIVGDVSGKGVPASLVMAITSSIFNTVSHNEESPAVIVTRLNKALINESANCNMFVTLIVGILDLETGLMRVCNAGHNPLILVDKKGSVTYSKGENNIPIGVINEYEYQEYHIQLSKESQIVLYTDGITEAEDESDNLYGAKRLKETIQANCGVGGSLLIDAVTKDLNEHVKDNIQSDDITMLVIDYKPQEDSILMWNLEIFNERQEISQLEGFVETIGEKLDLSPSLVMSINLALEEAMSNVILYSYPPSDRQKIYLKATYNPNELVFIISDTGKPFDPTQVGAVDVDTPLEDRPIGGLGIMLIRKIMDDVVYQRIDNTNQLILKKQNLTNKG